MGRGARAEALGAISWLGAGSIWLGGGDRGNDVDDAAAGADVRGRCGKCCCLCGFILLSFVGLRFVGGKAGGLGRRTDCDGQRRGDSVEPGQNRLYRRSALHAARRHSQSSVSGAPTATTTTTGANPPSDDTAAGGSEHGRRQTQRALRVGQGARRAADKGEHFPRGMARSS